MQRTRPDPRAPANAAPAGLALTSLAVAGWAFLAWIAVDMDSPVATLMMPTSPEWTSANAVAIAAMWALMMAAMMLPSAWPMVRTFAQVSARSGERSRTRAFVGAYVAVWTAFSLVATAVQWVFQRAEWLNPMIVSTSVPLTAATLVVAGVYQFSPLKRTCLSRCRTPIGFLLGDWRSGTRGAWTMGVRHGLLCVGCCWALMALLFVGGAMNLAWVAALAIVVAVEKMAPNGERIALALGVALLAAGVAKLGSLLG